jgi:hypothetical protein
MQPGSAVESLCAPVAKMAHKTASDAPLEHTGDHKRNAMYREWFGELVIARLRRHFGSS